MPGQCPYSSPLPMRSAVTQERCQQPTTQLHNNKQQTTHYTLLCMSMHDACYHRNSPPLSVTFLLSSSLLACIFLSFTVPLRCSFLITLLPCLPSLPFPSLWFHVPLLHYMSIWTRFFFFIIGFVYRFLQNKRRKGIRTGDPTWIIHISSS